MSDQVSPKPAFRECEWFRESTKRFDDGIIHFNALSEGERMEAVIEAAKMWSSYPILCEAIECLPDATATADEKRKLRDDLNYAHHKATVYLMMEAVRAGLNAGPLVEAKRVCQEIFHQVHGQGLASSNPYGVERFYHPCCLFDTWPDCLGAWRYSLPPAMQEAIRQGQEVFTQLLVLLSVTQASAKPLISELLGLEAWKRKRKRRQP
jgi:hypothetical protein